MILADPDPHRRRALAGIAYLPPWLLGRLANDPDDGVRARSATRDDLDRATFARFTDPTVEHSPVVWRSIAASRHGAAAAASLLATNDRPTLLILATNPSTTPDVLDRLAEHPDPDVAATVAATRTGSAPPASVISEVLDARAVATTPITVAPPGASPPGPPGAAERNGPPRPTPGPEHPDVESTADEPASHRGLVIGFVGVVVGIVIVAVVVFGVRGGKQVAVTDTSVVASTITVAPSAGPGPAGASPTSTTAPADDEPAGGWEPVTFDMTMTAQQKRFCKQVEIGIRYDAPLAYVVITDDTDRELWEGRWPSGTTRTIELVAPSDVLHASITTRTDPDRFKPSGSIHGSFC